MALEVDITKKLDGFFMHMQFRAEQEIFAILGASGCGKSMTLKCIAGIEKPDEGRIVLDGKVLFDSEKKINLPPQKRKVGYMFQDYALFPHMNVVQNIEAGMGKRPDRSRTESLIRQFQLEGLEKKIPGQLSGGQKQRVAMARMLAAEPSRRADSARRAVFSARYLSEMAVGAGDVQTSEGGRKTGHLRITQPR